MLRLLSWNTSLVAATIALLFSPSLSHTSRAELPADVAATVNGQPIPERLIEIFQKNYREAKGFNAQEAGDAAQMAKVRGAILDELIERALIAGGVAERGVAPTEAQIDAAEAKMREFTGDEERYQEFIRQNGFTQKEYRDVVLRSEANGEAMSAALGKEISVTDEDVKAYYEAHGSEPDFQWFERVHGAHILFDTRPGILGAQLKLERKLTPGPELDKAVAEEVERRRGLAEDVRRRAAAPGADFAALAQQYSDDSGSKRKGGSLATFGFGTHSQALDKAFFALKPGEVGLEVVQTEFGFHVVKTLDHQPAGPRSLAESTPEIRRRLTRAKLAQRLREWLQAAREKAAIVVRPSAPPPAR